MVLVVVLVMIHLGYRDVVGHDQLGERGRQTQTKAAFMVNLGDGQLPVDLPHLVVDDVLLDALLAGHALVPHDHPLGVGQTGLGRLLTGAGRREPGGHPWLQSGRQTLLLPTGRPRLAHLRPDAQLVAHPARVQQFGPAGVVAGLREDTAHRDLGLFLSGLEVVEEAETLRHAGAEFGEVVPPDCGPALLVPVLGRACTAAALRPA